MAKGPSEEQRKIIETLDKALFVKAGAGAGKTSTLVSRLIYALMPHMVDGKVEPPFLNSIDEALVITFTKKAAEELRSRVSALFIKEGKTEEALAVSDAWICTIHKMCERILRSSALEIGLDPEFRIIEDQDEQYFRYRASSEVLQRALAEEKYRELFVAYGSGLEGSGEGGALGAEAALPFIKQESALTLATKLFEEASSSLDGFDSIQIPGERPDLKRIANDLLSALQEFLETFTPNPERPAQVQLVENLEETEKELAAFLKNEGAEGAATADQMADVDADQKADTDQTSPAEEALLEIIETTTLPSGNNAPKSNKSAEEMPAAREKAKATLIKALFDLKSGAVLHLSTLLMELAKEMDEVYQNLKRAHGVLDTTDLLRLSLSSLKENEEVRRRYQGKFKLIMIDEFQDTDSQQLEIVRLIAEKNDVFCYVGDEQQAIYRFRGADVNQYRRVLDKARDVRTLNKNFRSHNDILRFVNFSLGETDILPNFMDLEHGRDEGEGLRPDFAEKLPERIYIEHVFQPKQKRGFSFVQNAVEENAGQIVNRLGELHKTGIPYSRMALLLRKMSHIDVFLDAFRQHSVNAVVAKGRGFAKSSEVQAISSLLVLLGSPKDTSLGLLPVLQGPLFSLDDEEVTRVMRAFKKNPSALFSDRDTFLKYLRQGEDKPSSEKPSSRVSHPPEITPRILGVQKTLHASLPFLEQGKIAEAVRTIVLESGWLYRLEGGAIKRAQAANVLESIEIISRIIDGRGYGAARAPKVFEDFLANVSQEPAALSTEDNDAVTIMTVHGAKGLEFDVVAVAEIFDEIRSAAKERMVLSKEGTSSQLSLKFENEYLGIDKKIEPPEDVGPADFELSIDFEPESSDKDSSAHASKTAFEWRNALVTREDEASAQEAIRLLYVAMTRAKEALVLGIVTKEIGDEIRPQIAERILQEISQHEILRGGKAPIQERSPQYLIPCEDDSLFFEFGGERPGLLTTERLALAEKSDEAPLPEEDSDALVEEAPSTFSLFEEDKKRSFPRFHLANQDVKSYSLDAHQVEEEAEVAESQPVVAAESTEGEPKEAAKTDTAQLPAATQAAEQTREKKESAWFASKMKTAENPAFAFGEAFHQTAQVMAETRRQLSPERIKAIARANNVPETEVARLEKAIHTWWESPLRKDMFSRKTLLAEAPFFTRLAPEEGGGYLTGFIDLLSVEKTPDGSRKTAFIVDYKTGETLFSEEEAQEHHAMQANYYAWVMMQEGYAEVAVSFILVENLNEDAEPLIVNYHFDAAHPATLGVQDGEDAQNA